jgi:hypothetical protein
MTHNKDCECDYCWSVIKTKMLCDGFTVEDYHSSKADTYRDKYEEKISPLRQQYEKTKKTCSENIIDDLRKEENKEILDKTRMFFHVLKQMNNVEKFIHQHGMIELFEDQRSGEYQWERFLKCDRSIIRWFNGADNESQNKFVLNLLYGNSICAQHIRSNS